MSECPRFNRAFPAAVLALVLLAAARPASADEPDSLKYWILFSDRGEVVSHSAGLDPVAISERALERRRMRSRGAPTDTDLPVFRNYLIRLNELNVHQLVESRWLNGVSAYLTPARLAAVRHLPFVREVRPVGVRRQLDATIDLDLTEQSPAPTVLTPSTSLSYGASFTQLNIVNAIPPLEAGYNGTGIRLGFLDTTFEGFTHPVFDRLRNEGRLIQVKNFAGSQSNIHGLRVASIAAGYLEGQLIGPGHGAEILAATTEYAPTETNQEEDNFVAGMEWLESMGVDVVNVSLGYTTFDAGQDSYTTDDLDGDTGITTIAADRAAELGVVVVVSAGNWVDYLSAQGRYCSAPAECWYYIGTPADGDSVIAVGGVDASGARASFSSYGPTADGRIKPDVSAMGASVYHALSGGQLATGSGTSFSAPMVSGVVTQMLQANPSLTPMQVLDILRQSGNQAASPDNSLGWGIIDAEVAVTAAIAVSVEDETPQDTFTLSAYPNPFSRYVTFSFETDRPGASEIRIFDLMGREIAVPHAADLPAGPHAIVWHASDLAAGVYVYSVSAPGGTRTGRIVRI